MFSETGGELSVLLKDLSESDLVREQYPRLRLVLARLGDALSEIGFDLATQSITSMDGRAWEDAALRSLIAATSEVDYEDPVA